MTKLVSLCVLALFLSVALAQVKKQIIFTGNLASSTGQFSFQAVASADALPTSPADIKFQNINFVLFGLDSTGFHNHTAYLPTDTCSEKSLREQYPDDAPFFEKQNLGFSFTPSSVTADASGNFVLGGVAYGSYSLLQNLYPTVPKCNGETECDPPAARTTTVSFSIRLSSAIGTYNELQRNIRAAEVNTIKASNWTLDYSLSSRISDGEQSRGFKNFKLSNDKLALPLALEFAIIDINRPYFYFWRKLKIQPVGVQRSPSKLCTGPNFCPCCTYIWLYDTTPTGLKGLNFGQPGADTQWKKAGITFDWQPIHYSTNAAFKSLDTTISEDVTFSNSYDDPTAIEIFFAYEFTPRSFMTGSGGGYTTVLGTASAKIVSTEAMIDECYKDFTHIAHELGHALGLTHPWVTGANSNYGTLMCGSGYCNDNPTRNSLQNQNNANNPLITYYLSTAIPPADDCTDNTNCGAC